VCQRRVRGLHRRQGKVDPTMLAAEVELQRPSFLPPGDEDDLGDALEDEADGEMLHARCVWGGACIAKVSQSARQDLAVQSNWGQYDTVMDDTLWPDAANLEEVTSTYTPTTRESSGFLSSSEQFQDEGDHADLVQSLSPRRSRPSLRRGIPLEKVLATELIPRLQYCNRISLDSPEFEFAGDTEFLQDAELPDVAEEVPHPKPVATAALCSGAPRALTELPPVQDDVHRPAEQSMMQSSASVHASHTFGESRQEEIFAGRKHDVQSLREMFPLLEADVLEDMLEAVGASSDVAAAIQALAQWEGAAIVATETAPNIKPKYSNSARPGARSRLEPVSPWCGTMPRKIECRDSSLCQNSPYTELVPLERREYDKTLASRLEKKYSGRQLAQVVKVASIWRHKACIPGFPRGGEVRRPVEPCGFANSMASAACEAKRTLSREAAIKEGKELLRQRCAFLGLRQVEVEDDGNCQFRAVAWELYGSQVHHTDVRAAVVTQLQCCADEYCTFFGAESWQQYLETMEQLCTWGDELTLRAAADVFRVRIHLVTSTSENWYLTYQPCGGLPHGARELFLTYLAPVHYNIVQPICDGDA